MRTLLVGLTLVMALAGAAQAERRMFVIANDADGYGIDRCLATSDRCGAAAANAYCKQHQFAAAAAYHKVERDEVTGAIPATLGGDGGNGGNGGATTNLVAIVCTR